MGTPLAKLPAENGALYGDGSGEDAKNGKAGSPRPRIAGLPGSTWSYRDSTRDESYVPPVSSVVAAPGGGLWYSSLSGIRRIDSPVSPALERRLSFLTGPIAAGPDSSLWTAMNDTLFKIKNDSISDFAAGLTGKEVIALLPVERDKVFLLTADAMACFQGGAVILTVPFGPMMAIPRLPIALDPDSALVFAAAGGLVRCVNGKSSIIVPTSRLGGRKITGFSRQGTVRWIAADDELFRFENGRALRIVLPQGPAAAFYSKCVRGPRGIMYVQSASRGIFRLNGAAWDKIDLAPGGAADEIQTLRCTPDGRLFVGTAGGLILFNGRGAVDLSKRSRLASGSITSAVELPGKGILYVLDDFKIVRTDGNSFSVEREGIPWVDGAVTALCAAADGTLWIADRSGISAALRDSVIVTFTAADGLPLTPVTQIFESRSGVKFARSIESVYRLEGRRWNSIGAADNVDGAAVTGIAEDKNGTFWIGTREGLCRFGEGRLSAPITKGLLSRGINAVDADSRGDIWAVTDEGVSKVTIQ